MLFTPSMLASCPLDDKICHVDKKNTICTKMKRVVLDLGLFSKDFNKKSFVLIRSQWQTIEALEIHIRMLFKVCFLAFLIEQSDNSCFQISLLDH